MMLSRVDLPEPEGPVIASQSPRATARSTSASAFTATSVPNRLPTLLSSRTVAERADASPTPRSATPRPCTVISLGALGNLVSDDDKLAWLECGAAGRSDLDVPPGREPGRHRHVFQRAAP